MWETTNLAASFLPDSWEPALRWPPFRDGLHGSQHPLSVSTPSDPPMYPFPRCPWYQWSSLVLSLPPWLWHNEKYMFVLYSYFLRLYCAYSLNHARLFATPWTWACQAPLSMGNLQAGILEWVALPSSRGSSQPRDRTQISHIAGGFFTDWATMEAQFLTQSPESLGVSWVIRASFVLNRATLAGPLGHFSMEAGHQVDQTPVRKLELSGLPWWSGG